MALAFRIIPDPGRRFAALTSAVVLTWATTAAAQDLGRYRDFALGSGVAAVSTLTGAPASEATVLQQRPALIQELAWRPRSGAPRSTVPGIESVARIVFAFHNDALYRVTVEYDAERTRGLTNADLIEAIRGVYGPVETGMTPSAAARTSASDRDPGALIAFWAAEDRTVRLYRFSAATSRFTLTVTNEPVAALAAAATTRAVVLDDRDLPVREAAPDTQDAEDRRAADEQARATNKGTFRP